MNIQQAIAAVATDVGAVGKKARMEAGPAKYNYRSLDHLVDAVHPALVKHGVTFAPTDVEIIDQAEKTTRSGSVQFITRAKVTYVIWGPEGDFITATILAEASDLGDKGYSKLMSQSFKYALGIVLSVAYSGLEDQDATVPEEVQAMAAASVTVPNGNPAAKLHADLADIALGLDVSMEQMTSKFREANGKLTLAEFYELPPERIRPFVRQVSTYAAEQKSK